MTYIYSVPKNTTGYEPKQFNVFHEFERRQSIATKSALYNPEIKRNQKRSFYIKSGIVLALTGTVLAIASRRFRFDASGLLKNILKKNNELIDAAKRSMPEKGTPLLLTLKIHALRAVNKVSSSCINILGNIDHLKNWLLSFFTEKIPVVSKGLGWLNRKLTPFFHGTVRKASVDKYKAAEKAALRLKDSINELAIMNPELRKIVGNSADDVVASLTKITNSQAFAARHKELNELLKVAVKEYQVTATGLTRDVHFYKTAGKLIDSTISLEIAKTKLLPHHLKLLELKRLTSFGHKDKIAVLDDLIHQLSYTKRLKPDAILIKKLQDARSAYSKAPSVINRDSILKVLDEVSQKVDHPKIARALSEAKAAVTANKLGTLQQLEKKLQAAFEAGHLNKVVYKDLMKQIRKANKQLAKAVEFEKTNLAGRLLDIRIGPTPLLETTGLIIPGVALANEVIQAENKQERISKTIIYTPTILGGLGATIYALQKGIFGVNALLYGVISGMIFNKIGKYVDDKYYSKGREFNTMKVLSSDQSKNPGVKVFEV